VSKFTNFCPTGTKFAADENWGGGRPSPTPIIAGYTTDRAKQKLIDAAVLLVDLAAPKKSVRERKGWRGRRVNLVSRPELRRILFKPEEGENSAHLACYWTHPHTDHRI